MGEIELAEETESGSDVIRLVARRDGEIVGTTAVAAGGTLTWPTANLAFTPD